MNIKIVDSWLREFLKTEASPQVIAEKLSLTSVSVERITQVKDAVVYDIEVTTNRPDMMSVINLAQETATILSQFNIKASFIPPHVETPKIPSEKLKQIEIISDPKLVFGLEAVIMDVKLHDSPKYIKERLEASGIRSLNNVIDVTNYIMRETGHPTHVFDYDRLLTKKLIIRESHHGEKITTLDNREHTLQGGDIVADDGNGQIVDLLGVMGTANSVVTNKTKTILFFIDSVEPHHIRKTSMHLGIRSEAAILNEKGVNPQLEKTALSLGITLFEKIAEGRVASKIIAIPSAHIQSREISLTKDKIDKVVGVIIPLEQVTNILTQLGYTVAVKESSLRVTIPPIKMSDDMTIAEDVIEEIARVYGYHNIPSTLPTEQANKPFHLENDFYWEDRIKDAVSYWGFTEVYTYPMVSEELYEGPLTNAVTIQNPLGTDMVYMRQTLVPSLLSITKQNKNHKTFKIFEIANVYIKKAHALPEERLKLAGIIKKQNISFFEVKGTIEKLCEVLGIKELSFTSLESGGLGANLHIHMDLLGDIEVLDDETIDFEMDCQVLFKHATNKKIYAQQSKYPSIVEDLAIIAPSNVSTGEIIKTILQKDPLIVQVTLLDKYDTTRTFHIRYQSFERNLTDEDVAKIRQRILKALWDTYSARLKE